MIGLRASCVLIVVVLCASGCANVEDDAAGVGSISPTAKLETVAMLLKDLEAPRHPSDGGGRAWLEGEVQPVAVGRSASYTVHYEAGPDGIADGGALYFLPSPFWGWSGAQAVDPARPGYTEVHTAAQGIDLQIESPDGQILVVTVTGRSLRPGEKIVLTYGAGSRGATVDRFAENASRLWVAVDGDGDGIRAVLDDSPVVPVAAGPPARLVMTLPSVARPNDPVRLTVAVLDAAGNAGVDFSGTVVLTTAPVIGGIPAKVVLDSDAQGITTAVCRFQAPGTYRVAGATDGGITGVSNPVNVSAEGAPIYWGDLHGHSALSDGTASPEEYLSYARDVAALDVVALTDHDHWGVQFLDQEPDLWAQIQKRTREFHEPGRFVTLLGFEWTNWAHGHRHVLYFDDDGEVLSSVDARFDTAPELWEALRGTRALTVAHHSAGGPVATNWDDPPDPEFEPVTEVVSVHGSSEASDSPHPIYSAVGGNFVRDVLDRGFVFGFVGSGDSHDGHPGLAHLASGVGGVAAFLADELTRDGIRRALVERRVYATSGPRIILRFAVGGHPMGSIVEPPGAPLAVFVAVHGTAPIDRIDLVRSGNVVASSPGDGQLDLTVGLDLEDLVSGEYVYVRAVQEGGGAAWSSPVYFR